MIRGNCGSNTYEVKQLLKSLFNHSITNNNKNKVQSGSSKGTPAELSAVDDDLDFTSTITIPRSDISEEVVIMNVNIS